MRSIKLLIASALMIAGLIPTSQLSQTLNGRLSSNQKVKLLFDSIPFPSTFDREIISYSGLDPIRKEMLLIASAPLTPETILAAAANTDFSNQAIERLISVCDKLPTRALNSITQGRPFVDLSYNNLHTKPVIRYHPKTSSIIHADSLVDTTYYGAHIQYLPQLPQEDIDEMVAACNSRKWICGDLVSQDLYLGETVVITIACQNSNNKCAKVVQVVEHKN